MLRNLRSSASRVLIVMVLVVLLTPSASAAATINRPFDIEAIVSVPSDPDRARDEAFLISGALSFEADLRGVLVGTGDVASRFQVGRIQVFDANDGEAFARGQPVLRAENAALQPLAGASYAWSFPQAHARGATGHTVGLVVDVESHLSRVATFVPEREGGPLPHLVVDGRGGEWTFSAEVGRSVLLPIDGGFAVQPERGAPRTFQGTDWIVFMEHGTEARLEAIGLAMPTQPDLSIRFGRADDDVFTERFTSARVNTFVNQALDLARIVQDLDGPPEFAEPDCLDDPLSCLPAGASRPTVAMLLDPFPARLDDAAPSAAPTGGAAAPPRSVPAPAERLDAHDAPEGGTPAPSPLGLPDGVLENAGSMLNGAIVGNLTGEVLLGDQSRPEPALSVMRFEHMDVGGFGNGQAAMTGSSPFAYSGGGAYSTTAAIQVAYLIVPILSIILFVVAIALFLVSRLRAPDEDEAKGRHLHTWSRVARYGLLALALLLFDRELYLIFGESVLATVGFWGGAGFSWGRLGIIFLVEALVWSYAALLFGLPVGIIGRATLRLSGFSKRTYGFAAGIGAVAAFALGVGLIRPLLGAVVGTIEGAF